MSSQHDQDYLLRHMKILNLKFNPINNLKKNDGLLVEAIDYFDNYTKDAAMLVKYDSDEIIRISEDMNSVISTKYQLIIGVCRYDCINNNVEYEQDLFQFLPKDVIVQECNVFYNINLQVKCQIQKTTRPIIWCSKCNGPAASFDGIIKMLKDEMLFDQIPNTMIKYIKRSEKTINIDDISKEEIEKLIMGLGHVGGELLRTKEIIDNMDDEIERVIEEMKETKRRNELKMKLYTDDLGGDFKDSIQFLFDVIKQRNKQDLRKHMIKQKHELDIALLKVEHERLSLAERNYQLNKQLINLKSYKIKSNQ